MHKSSHAWNTFRAGWTPEGKEYLFKEQKRSTTVKPDGTRVVEKTYRDIWMSSTDYSEATDKLRHEVAKPIAEYWMKKCGIPPILQMIVKGTCFAPRPIVFEAYGPMKSYGEEWTHDSPFREPRFVMHRQGVLMGDPLTKVCLHLVNILVRKVGENYSSPRFLQKVFPLREVEVKQYIDSYCEDPVPPEFVMNLEEAYVPLTEDNTATGQGPPGPLLSFHVNGLTEKDKPDKELSISRHFDYAVKSKIIKEKEKAPDTKKPTPDAALPKSQTRRPLGFVLTDDWLRTPKKFNVVNSDGSIVAARLNACKLQRPRNPPEARQFTFRCVQLKNALIAAEQNAIKTAFVEADTARRIALQEGFKWTIPSSTSNITRPGPSNIEQYTTPQKSQYTYVQAKPRPAYTIGSRDSSSPDSDLEYCTESSCAVS
jgi:hypothetical protein